MFVFFLKSGLYISLLLSLVMVLLQSSNTRVVRLGLVADRPLISPVASSGGSAVNETNSALRTNYRDVQVYPTAIVPGTMGCIIKHDGVQSCLQNFKFRSYEIQT